MQPAVASLASLSQTHPGAIKEHRNLKKPNGFPFNPSQRPLIQFRGNTAHSSGKWVGV